MPRTYNKHAFNRTTKDMLAQKNKHNEYYHIKNYLSIHECSKLVNRDYVALRYDVYQKYVDNIRIQRLYLVNKLDAIEKYGLRTEIQIEE